MAVEQLILSIPALLLAISIHEFAHGYVAFRLGDPTPKFQGRLTLNPLAHLDPLGAIMLIMFRFGWAKPVMINPVYFKDRRKGSILVALAGPLANITLAWVFYTMHSFWPIIGQFSYFMQVFFLINIQLNLGLAAFNLLPFPPLDGSKIVAGLLPPRMAYSYQRISQYGPFLLILLLVTGLAQFVLQPIYRVLYFVISGFGL